MELAGVVIGSLGLIASIGALVFAYRSASRSERLLRRLVVYPFRELDTKYGILTQTERASLLALFRLTRRGRGTVGESILSGVRTEVPEFSTSLQNYLTEQGWLQREGDGSMRINPDRLPYLTFVQEGERSRGES